jgi:hypothetical protein
MQSSETMNIEAQVSPGEETLIQSSELPADTPEVAAPEGANEEAQEEKPADNPQDKTIQRFQRRIDRISAARYQAEAEARSAQQRLQELQQRVQQYEGTQEQQAPQQPNPFELAKVLRDLDKVTERSNQVAKEGAKRFSDFNAALSAVVEEAGPLVVPVAPGAQVGRPTPLGEAVLEADDPAAVLHYLGTNPEVASELHGLSAVQLARRIARIESELSKPAAPKVSSAPKPISPTKAVGRDTGALSDDLPVDEWRRRFFAQRKR